MVLWNTGTNHVKFLLIRTRWQHHPIHHYQVHHQREWISTKLERQRDLRSFKHSTRDALEAIKALILCLEIILSLSPQAMNSWSKLRRSDPTASASVDRQEDDSALMSPSYHGAAL